MGWKAVRILGYFEPCPGHTWVYHSHPSQACGALGLLGSGRTSAKRRVGRVWVVSSELSGHLPNASMGKSELVR
jgi:hypothetical protein